MSSSIPGTMTYFLQLMRTTLPTSPPTTIHFGKELSVYQAPLTFQCIGWHGNQVPAELGPSFRREEHFSIMCILSSLGGDQNWETRQTEVMNAFQLITVAIANDGTLGGNVRYAEPGNFMFTPEPTKQGRSLGSLAFDIRCSQRIASLT